MEARAGVAGRLWVWRRRLAPVVLVAAALLVGRELGEGVSRETEVVFELGPLHAEVREARVSYVRDGVEMATTVFRYGDGAPATIRHSIELLPGDYVVRVELRRVRGGEARERRLTVPTDGVVHLRLSGDPGHPHGVA